jgi:hypothetical protein
VAATGKLPPRKARTGRGPPASGCQMSARSDQAVGHVLKWRSASPADARASQESRAEQCALVPHELAASQGGAADRGSCSLPARAAGGGRAAGRGTRIPAFPVAGSRQLGVAPVRPSQLYPPEVADPDLIET